MEIFWLRSKKLIFFFSKNGSCSQYDSSDRPNLNTIDAKNMNTFCSSTLTAGQLWFFPVNKEEKSLVSYQFEIGEKNYLIRVKANYGFKIGKAAQWFGFVYETKHWNMKFFLILTIITEVGYHGPYCCNDGGKSEHKPDKNPNTSASGFKTSAIECNIAIYLEQKVDSSNPMLLTKFGKCLIHNSLTNLSLSDWIDHD